LARFSAPLDSRRGSTRQVQPEWNQPPRKALGRALGITRWLASVGERLLPPHHSHRPLSRRRAGHRPFVGVHDPHRGRRVGRTGPAGPAQRERHAASGRSKAVGLGWRDGPHRSRQAVTRCTGLAEVALKPREERRRGRRPRPRAPSRVRSSRRPRMTGPSRCGPSARRCRASRPRIDQLPPLDASDGAIGEVACGDGRHGPGKHQPFNGTWAASEITRWRA